PELVPGARVVSPRGDVLEGTMLRYFRRTGEGVYDMDDLWARAEAMGDMMATEKEASGPSRTIAMGYSNGANILAAVSLIRPDIVDDAVFMHPLIPWSPDPQPGLAGRRVLITAGERDPLCPAPQTQAFADYLTAQGADVSLHWHPGGHEIDRSEFGAIARFLADAPRAT
ncbi:MAG: alpha/beta hydrolase, partial [Pseudomonadota bacterium]